MACTKFLILAGVAASCLPTAMCDAFLKAKPGRGGVGDAAQFRQAMEEVMGCGGDVDTVRLSHVEKALLPIWRVLPKNSQGRAEWRMMRYAAHRYFMGQMSVLVRGFEPSRLVNTSDAGAADIMNERVPSLVQSVLEGAGSGKDFTLQDAVAMIAALERLMFDAESALLQQAISASNVPDADSFSHHELLTIVENYMVHWMLGNDAETVQHLMRKPALRKKVFPHWDHIVQFAHGNVLSMEYLHRNTASGDGRIAMNSRYSFEDAHEVVGGITKTFASYWESECQAIKASLVGLDKTGTGRVKLSDFYGANSDGEWRFGESEEYLRELGALDESSSWRGKEVIIPNYLQGASNCIVTTENYLVCCVSECESVLNEVEDAIGASVASPDEIIPLVRSIASYEDDTPKLDGALENQLRRIAETHGGKIPLHGRLFGQWLHYVFPRECPFPHKAGTVTQLAPREYGGETLASEDAVLTHASQRGSMPSSDFVAANEAQWMTQWSEEEELHVEYDELRVSWGCGRLPVVVVLTVLLFAAYLVHSPKDAKGKHSAQGVFEPKAHFV